MELELKVNACGVSHTGNIRRHNEDNIYVDGGYRTDLSKENFIVRSKRETGPYTYGVFDGLGGETNGAQASLIAAACLREADVNNDVRNADAYVSNAHAAVIKASKEQGAYSMGTTAVVANIEGDEALIYNVGDSRAYLYRDGRLKQLTEDHNSYQSMKDGGFAEEAEHNKERYQSELTQYIGMTSDEDIEPEAYTKVLQLQAGDILLLCSDGLIIELSDEDMEEELKQYMGETPDYMAAALLKRAVEGKCKDNASVIVCTIEER